jgi:hypothetical protein
LARELRLVALLDAILADAVAIDEAEELRGEGRVRRTAGQREDPLRFRLERQAGEVAAGESAADPLGGHLIDAQVTCSRGRDHPVGQVDRVRLLEVEEADEALGRLLAVLRLSVFGVR